MTIDDEGHGPDATAAALRVLTLRPDDEKPDVFWADSLHHPNGRVYGGQVLAQALLAAGATVPQGREAHSLHGYFLRAGDPDEPIELRVERLRDGRSFSARRTHAYQFGQPILSFITSFQDEQPGVDYHEPMPIVPGPLQVPSVDDLLGHIDHPVARFLTRETGFEIRHVNGALYLGPAKVHEDRQMLWMRARGPVPGDQLLHRAALAYACDQVLLEPVLRRSGNSWLTPGMSVASLDHAMWWHRDVHVDDWLLYVQSSPTAQGGRGLGLAHVYDSDGAMVATVAQEGMLRFPDA